MSHNPLVVSTVIQIPSSVTTLTQTAPVQVHMEYLTFMDNTPLLLLSSKTCTMVHPTPRTLVPVPTSLLHTARRRRLSRAVAQLRPLLLAVPFLASH
jgi:hypothetical protein